MPGTAMATSCPRFKMSETGEAIPDWGVGMRDARMAVSTARLGTPGPEIPAAQLGIVIPGPGIAKPMTGTRQQQQVL